MGNLFQQMVMVNTYPTALTWRQTLAGMTPASLLRMAATATAKCVLCRRQGVFMVLVPGRGQICMGIAVLSCYRAQGHPDAAIRMDPGWMKGLQPDQDLAALNRNYTISDDDPDYHDNERDTR